MKVLGLVLATSLLFSACGNDAKVSKESSVTPTEKESVASESSETAASEQEEKKELVTLNWYLTKNGTHWGTEQVTKSVHDYVLEKLNVDLQIHWLTKAEYREKVGTMLTAGGEVDICFTATTYANFAEYAQMGAFYPLNEFMDDELAGTVDVLPEGVWPSVTFDENVYAIPNMKDLVSRYGLKANQTMLDDLGVSMPAKLQTAADLIPMLREAKAAQIAKYPEKAKEPLMAAGFRHLSMFYFMDAMQGEMVVANIPGLKGFAGYGEGETVFCPYYTQEYRDTMNLVQDMVEEKIFAYDPKEFDADKTLFNTGGLIGQFAEGSVYLDPDTYAPYYTVKWYPCESGMMSSSYVRAACTAISATCKYPERAAEVIELFNTDGYLETLIRFGEEGIGWTDKDNNGVIEFEGTQNEDSSNRYWYNWYGMHFGSMYQSKMPPGYPEPAEFLDMLDELNESGVVSENIGFVFDTTNVVNEVAACSAVVAEYHTGRLYNGQEANVDEIIDEFIAKLKANGMDKIVEECQKQLTEWRAAKGLSTK